MKKTKLGDVAKRAGVSVAAVSFAINGKPGVSHETRQMIFRVIEELGYSPLTKSMQPKSETKNILLLNCSRTAITSDIFPQTPYFSELLRAFEAKLSDLGYAFRVKTLHIEKSFQHDLVSLFRGSDVDGVLLVATDMQEEDVAMVQRIEPRLVVLDAMYDALDVNCVVMDNHLGGALAARHFIEAGHLRIGYIQSKIRIPNFEMRKVGFFSELQRHGLSCAEEDVWSVDSSIDASCEALVPLLKASDSRPTAFFAENDYMAIGMLRALLECGIRVPDDVSVVGFDNIDMASIVTPALTSLNVPKGKLADCALSQLRYIMNHETYWGIKQLVSVDLVERTSSMRI